jgi:hypothetical protein
MLPIQSQAELSKQSPSIPIAIEMHVESQVAWGPADWKQLTDEVDRIWAPYGLTLCWAQRSNPCAGWDVRLSVTVVDDLSRRVTPAGPGNPIVGRILFDAGGPRTDIALSLRAARGLVEQARLGDERLQNFPAESWNALVPRVLGRALAHEIGHYVLQSRGHSRRGLMTASFRPYEVTFGPTSWFRLTHSDAVAVRALRLVDAGSRSALARRMAFAPRGSIG